MIEVSSNYNKNKSTVKISEEVIATIASTAALEVDGVCGMTSNFSDLTDLLYKNKKNCSKGVKIEIENNEIYINLNLFVKMNYKVHKISEEVQSRVKSSVETMTGLTVNTVNVNVTNVVIDKNNKGINQLEN